MVDNGGADATADCCRRFPWVRLMRSERNLGFTLGNNLAYAASSGRFVLFLNPDTEVIASPAGDSLWRLYSAVAGDDRGHGRRNCATPTTRCRAAAAASRG